MREIKFRAVYSPDKETMDGYLMFYQTEEDYKLWFKYNDDIRYPFEVPFMDNDWILMQYTGLKDRNGKEIYEGDIVKANHPDAGSFIGTIEWDTEQASFIFRGEAIANIFLWCFDEFKVIGNIYENPELFTNRP